MRKGEEWGGFDTPCPYVVEGFFSYFVEMA